MIRNLIALTLILASCSVSVTSTPTEAPAVTIPITVKEIDIQVDPYGQPDTTTVAVDVMSDEVTIVGDSLANQMAAFNGFVNEGQNFCGYTYWAFIQWPEVHDQPHPGCRIEWERVTGREGIILMSLTTHDMVLRGDSVDDLEFRFTPGLYMEVDAIMRAANPDAAIVWYANFLAPTPEYAEREAANIAAVEALGLTIISDHAMMNDGTVRYDGSHYDEDSAILVGQRLLIAARETLT